MQMKIFRILIYFKKYRPFQSRNVELRCGNAYRNAFTIYMANIRFDILISIESNLANLTDKIVNIKLRVDNSLVNLSSRAYILKLK